MTLLTLVENAVRHGIDPSVEGGRIDVSAAIATRGRCHLTGGRHAASACKRTAAVAWAQGWLALRERLQLVFGGDGQTGAQRG